MLKFAEEAARRMAKLIECRETPWQKRYDAQDTATRQRQAERAVKAKERIRRAKGSLRLMTWQAEREEEQGQ